MTFLRSWLLSIVACAVLVSLAEHLTDGGTMKKIVRFTGGMLLMLAMLRPLLRLDLSTFEVDISSYREAVSQLELALTQQREDALSARIAAETEAYIEDKAHALGAEVTAEVTVREEDGAFIPNRAVLFGEENAELSVLLTQELGIAPEKQEWRAER